MLAAFAALAGCAADCPKAICPRNTVDWHALDDSSVTWAVRDSTPRTTTGFGSAPAGSPRCSLRVVRSSIFPTASGGETLQDGYLAVTCAGATGDKFVFLVNHIGDVRDWSIGMLTVTAPDLYAEYDPTSAPAVATTGECNVPDLSSVSAAVTVEIASGGALPSPKLVTDDFVRTFWFDFDISNGMLTDYDGVPCTFPVTANVSLHLTQTAADYVHDPNALCGCE